MSLQEVAKAVDVAPVDTVNEVKLRAWLTNLLADLKSNQVKSSVLHARLQKLATHFLSSPEQSLFYLACAYDHAMNPCNADNQFCRPGPLDNFLDYTVVTIVSEPEHAPCSNAWLKRSVSAASLPGYFRRGECIGYVGVDYKPLWITPYCGEIKAMCEKASRGLSRSARADLVRGVMGKLGLKHLNAGEELLAFVSELTVGELTFFNPSTNELSPPVGSTVIEARLHRQFRHWPRNLDPDAYGRTYELDSFARQYFSNRLDYGLPEATRPRLQIDDFERCIYLGRVPEPDFDDADETYLKEIGADLDCATLLRTIGKELGL